MLNGKHLPSWLRDKENHEARKTAIESLKSEDLFRNQFRPEANAPRAPVEIINWGLEHIERLRKANSEAREEKQKRVTSYWLPLISAITALLAVLGGSVSQTLSLRSQTELKYYEVELTPKREGYIDFVKSLDEAYANAEKHRSERIGGFSREDESRLCKS